MLDVILDTSSLISFTLASKYHEFPPGDLSGFHRLERGFDNTIEALVLYENIWIDGPSYQRNLEKYPELKSIVKHCRVIELDAADEQEAYRSIYELQNHIQGNSLTVDLFRGHTQTWMTDECDAGRTYPSSRWSDIENVLPENLREFALLLRSNLGKFIPYSGAACLAILLTFYYQSLQRMVGADLLLDPWKGYFYEQRGTAPNILDMFDKSVRVAYYERKKKWLGREKIEIVFPLLTQFVFNKSNSWRDVLDISIQLRHSKEAITFRKGMAQLTEAIETNDNKLVDESISSLQNAQEIWSRRLGAPLVPDRTISITVPFIEVGTEFTIPNISIQKRASDKILVFIHLLLRHS